MSKVVVNCTDQYAWGKTLVLPLAGETEVSETGEISVDQEVADFLVSNGGGGWEHSEAKSKAKSKAETKVTEAAKAEKEPKADKEPKKEKEAKSDDKITKDELKALDLSAIIEIAEAAGIDPTKYEKLKKSKPLMVDFILKNI